MPLSFPGKFCSLFRSPSMYPCTGGIRKHDSTELNSFLERKEHWPLREKETNICPYRRTAALLFMEHTLCARHWALGFPFWGNPGELEGRKGTGLN